MKSAFYFDAKTLGRSWSLDSRTQALSGTDGILLEVYRSLSSDKESGVVLLSTLMPLGTSEGVNLVNDLVDAYRFCEKQKIDYLVFVAKSDKEQENLFKMGKTNVKLIGWAHNTPSYKWLTSADSCDSFLRLITVSNVQRYGLAHHRIYRKTSAIFNFVDADSVFTIDKIPDCSVITYIGALKRSKGFHHLSKVWREIRQRHPEALLNVCGSPGLYNADCVLGKYEIAEVEYEKTILADLGGSREAAESLGVKFWGSVGKDRLFNLIQNSSVVVVNPNTTSDGSIETFCVSAAEALLCKIPVVGGMAGGLLEVVGHNVGGILVNNDRELYQALNEILKNRVLGKQLGEVGSGRILKYFSREASIQRWKSLLSGVKIKGQAEIDLNVKSSDFYFRSAFRILSPAFLQQRMKKIKIS